MFRSFYSEKRKRRERQKMLLRDEQTEKIILALVKLAYRVKMIIFF